MKAKCVSKSNSLLFSITGCITKILSMVDLHFLNPSYLFMKTASFIILASLSLFWRIHFLSAIKNTNIPIVVTSNLICFLGEVYKHFSKYGVQSSFARKYSEIYVVYLWKSIPRISGILD